MAPRPRARHRHSSFGALRRALARAERGQAIVIIGVAILGLLAFIGLTIDTGILFIGVGHLRRAVDAAALAAASQFREGRSLTDLTKIATEVIALNEVSPDSVQIHTCETDPTDTNLCTIPRRKLVRVAATMEVRFAFLTLIGFHSTVISADASSEAASLDVVLAIDTSDSMANAANPVLGESPDPAVCNVVTTTPPDPQGFTGNCHPFLEVKKAAYSFIQRLKEPYDRLAVVTYDLSPQVVVPLTNTMTLDQIGNIVKTLNVSPRHSPGDGACTYPPDPSGCVNTSIGGGLQIGAGEFGRQPIRQEAVWVVILLTDGAANASVPIPGNLNPACPNTTWVQPFCRDASAATRHAITDTINAVPTVGTVLPNGAVYDPGQYDADDFARDMADFAACASRVAEAAPWCRVSLDYASGQGGQGAVVFGIGLGPLVINFCCGDRDAGDRLLRYIAAVGDDGNAETDPCLGATVPVLTTGNDSYNCGNYFFSEFGSGLSDVFGSIASRIFTRLTH